MWAWYVFEPCGRRLSIVEVRRITDRRDQGRRGSRAQARNRQETWADRIGLTDRLQLLVIIRETRLQG
jgi:hypothetical protein